MPDAPKCLRCREPAALYRIHYTPVWACRRCDTRVGCHEGTNRPLGVLADEQTRSLRRQVHGAFDHIWMEGERAGVARADARHRAYLWLARNLDLQPERCHVALFDAEMCDRALAFLRRDGVFYSWSDVEGE